LHFNIYKRYYT